MDQDWISFGVPYSNNTGRPWPIIAGLLLNASGPSLFAALPVLLFSGTSSEVAGSLEVVWRIDWRLLNWLNRILPFSFSVEIQILKQSVWIEGARIEWQVEKNLRQSYIAFLLAVNECPPTGSVKPKLNKQGFHMNLHSISHMIFKQYYYIKNCILKE